MRTRLPTLQACGLGDAARGRLLFEGRANCLSCHRVVRHGADAGPDLTDAGASAHGRPRFSRSLLDPTGSMRPINRPVRAVTRDGTVITGRRLNEDTYTVQLIDRPKDASCRWSSVNFEDGQ